MINESEMKTLKEKNGKWNLGVRPNVVLEKDICAFVPNTFLRASVGEKLGFCKKK